VWEELEKKLFAKKEIEFAEESQGLRKA